MLDIGLADAVLLDNMDPATMRKAVAMVGGPPRARGSGGITLDNDRRDRRDRRRLRLVRRITHSAPNLDVALDIEM